MREPQCATGRITVGDCSGLGRTGWNSSAGLWLMEGGSTLCVGLLRRREEPNPASPEGRGLPQWREPLTPLRLRAGKGGMCAALDSFGHASQALIRCSRSPLAE